MSASGEGPAGIRRARRRLPWRRGVARRGRPGREGSGGAANGDGQPPLLNEPALLASESGAAAADVALAPTSLAALLTGHILRDGELVLLILKPSLWWVLFSSLRFLAAVLIGVLGVNLFRERLPGNNAWAYTEAGVFLMAGRLMWAVLQWMGRLYVLTDLRVVRLSGVFAIDLFDCPLRKVARTQLTASVKERLLRLGSIDLFPREDHGPPTTWQTIAHPVEVHEQIQAALRRAQNNGGAGCRP